MNNTAIHGLQWGDEGKGKVTDIEAAEHNYVVRYNGGANAGHSVVVGGQRLALHLIPSGINHPRVINVIANGVVLDIPTLLQELAELRQHGIATENLRISNRAHLVMPYHKLEDALLEAYMSRGKKIGTTGRGIGPCYADKALRATALRVIDLYDRKNLLAKLKQIVKLKNCYLTELAVLTTSPFELISATKLYQELLEHSEAVRPYVCDTAELLNNALTRGERMLFEGANGFLLDVDHGTYPFVTSSTTSALGISAGAGVPNGVAGRVIGIMKSYTTRVGAGPFPTELNDEIGNGIRERGHEYGTTTGRPRRCGWLDLALVKYSARLSGTTHLAVMLLDVLSGLPQLQVCVGYEYRGKWLDKFPAHAPVLDEARPIYDEVDGFSEDIRGCRDFNDLPLAAQNYLKKIEAFVGVPVWLISVGPDRSETIIK